MVTPFAYSSFGHLPDSAAELQPVPVAAPGIKSEFYCQGASAHVGTDSRNFVRVQTKPLQSRCSLYSEDTCGPAFSLVLVKGAQVVKKLIFSFFKAF